MLGRAPLLLLATLVSEAAAGGMMVYLEVYYNESIPTGVPYYACLNVDPAARNCNPDAWDVWTFSAEEMEQTAGVIKRNHQLDGQYDKWEAQYLVLTRGNARGESLNITDIKLAGEAKEAVMLTSIRISIRRECRKIFYGPRCRKGCQEGMGWTCSSEGDRICEPNWIPPHCIKCIPGWTGIFCDESVPTNETKEASDRPIAARLVDQSSAAPIHHALLSVPALLALIIIIAVALALVTSLRRSREATRSPSTVNANHVRLLVSDAGVDIE